MSLKKKHALIKLRKIGLNTRGVPWGGALGYKSPPQLGGASKILLNFGEFKQFFYQTTPKFLRSLRSRAYKHNIFDSKKFATNLTRGAPW